VEENQNPVPEVPNTTPPVEADPSPTEPHIGSEVSTPPVILSETKDLSPTDPKPAKKFSLKLIIGIIIFLLLAGGAAAASFYVFKQQSSNISAKPTTTPTVIPGLTRNPVSPTPDPTANWNTYIGHKYSFKYPPSWKEDSPSESGWLISTNDLNLNSTAPKGAYIYEPWTKDAIPVWNSNFSKLQTKEITLDGQPASIGSTKDVGVVGSVGLTVRYRYPKSNQYLGEFSYISLVSSPKEYDQNLVIFNQILSTFKFTDTSTVNTSNWKTYKNTAVGFEFKYPDRYPSPPSLPSGPGEDRKADGTETNNHIIIGTSSTDSFGVNVFPFNGTLNSLPMTDKAKSTPVYDWEGKTTTITTQQTKVDSIDALLLTGNYKQSTELPFRVVFFTRKGYGYVVTFSQNYSNAQIIQILSTFKFTK